jgi:predicted sulfurtransferase
MLNSDIGRFKNATKMNVDTFRESLQVLDALVADRPKDEAIYMYCTGGIRCSVAGAYVRKKGYSNVNMVSINQYDILSLFYVLISHGHWPYSSKVE